MSKDLRSFLAEAAEHQPGGVKVVEASTDPQVGVAQWVAGYAARGEHPALLFPRMAGSELGVVTNVVATDERLALACGIRLESLRTPSLAAFAGAGPEAVEVSVDAAPVKQVVWRDDQVDLGRLPVPTHRRTDAGPFLTAAVAIMRDPWTGNVHAGIYRCQVHGPRLLGMWNLGTHHAAKIVHHNEQAGRDTPVALAIGHHPALLLAAVARLEDAGGEYRGAGALLQAALEVVSAETSDLPVPARAEIIIEGHVKAGLSREEGPFTEWTDVAVGGGHKPVIEVGALTMRDDAIFQDIQPRGREHQALGTLPRVAAIHAQISEVVAELAAVRVPLDVRMHCYVALRKSDDAEPVRAGMAAFEAERDHLRLVVVVDDDVDVWDDGDVWWAIGTRFDAVTDLTVLPDHHPPGGVLPTT